MQVNLICLHITSFFLHACLTFDNMKGCQLHMRNRFLCVLSDVLHKQNYNLCDTAFISLRYSSKRHQLDFKVLFFCARLLSSIKPIHKQAFEFQTFNSSDTHSKGKTFCCVTYFGGLLRNKRCSLERGMALRCRNTHCYRLCGGYKWVSACMCGCVFSVAFIKATFIISGCWYFRAP